MSALIAVFRPLPGGRQPSVIEPTEAEKVAVCYLARHLRVPLLVSGIIATMRITSGDELKSRNGSSGDALGIRPICAS